MGRLTMNGGPLTERLDAMQTEARERLDDMTQHLAALREASDRAQIRGDAFSRVAAIASTGGAVTELAVVPRPGVAWEIQGIVVQVPNLAAARFVALYLGDLGDVTRPLGSVQCGVAAAAAEGIGLQLATVFPVETTQGVYARFLALPANEQAVLHVFGRELLLAS